MRPHLLRVRLMPVLLLLPGLGACAVAPPPAVVQPAPPPPPAPVVEAVPVAPSAFAMWRPGHWRWTGIRWVWIRGHYVVRPA